MPQNDMISKQDDELLKLWYITLGLSAAGLVISLYSLYRYHQKNGNV